MNLQHLISPLKLLGFELTENKNSLIVKGGSDKITKKKKGGKSAPGALGSVPQLDSRHVLLNGGMR